MLGCDCEMTARNAAERKTLWIVLWVNAVMFAFELSLGLSGLFADSLDMFADASVYGIGLYAVGKGTDLKIKAARHQLYGANRARAVGAARSAA